MITRIPQIYAASRVVAIAVFLAFTSAVSDTSYGLPVRGVQERNTIRLAASTIKTSTPYLTFTARQAGSSVTFAYDDGTDMQYRTNLSEWVSCPSGGTVVLPRVGDSVQYRGYGVKTSSDHHFSMSGEIVGSGSVTSLTDGIGDDKNVPLSEGCYDSMFYECSSLKEPPELPSVSLSDSCYMEMFHGAGIVVAPSLPAIQLKEACYCGMFCDCTGLTEAPILPAKYTAPWCCDSMFYGCQNLKKVPYIATVSPVDVGCFSWMFAECSSLTYIATAQATFAGCDSWAFNVYDDGEFHCTQVLLDVIGGTSPFDYGYSDSGLPCWWEPIVDIW